MKLKNNIAVSESGFVFDANSGDSYSLNKTGRLLLTMISQGKKMAEIFDELQREYDVDNEELMHYLDDFKHMLKRYELIEDEEV